MFRLNDKEIKKNGLLINRLNSLYGINYSRLNYILSLLGIANYINLSHLNKYIFDILKQLLLDKYYINKRLKFFLSIIFNQYIKLRTYKGIRYTLGLPVNGQTTRSNGKGAKINKGLVNFFK